MESTSSCDQMTAYEGEVCLNELTQWQQCFSPQSDAIYIPSNINQEEAEATAQRFLLGLSLLSPSPECEAAIRPFLCLYLFGSCDSNNQTHQATKANCISLRDVVCAQEFAQAERIVGQDMLPNCDDLIQQEEECQGMRDTVTLINC